MVAVSPPESIAGTTTELSPAETNECAAVFVVDHDVSHVPSPVQSQRTWIALGGSRSSLTCAVNVNTVLASPDVGVQPKSAVGGEFAGGGGGGAGTETTCEMFAISPPESIACTTTGWSSAEANECS